MGYRVSTIVSLAVLAGALPAAAADWDAHAVGQDLSQGQGAPALTAANARLAAHPDDPQARFFKAMALAETGDIAQAIDIYEALGRQYPQRARVWNNLGILYARAGQLDKARGALVQALDVEPDYAVAEQNLGDVYVALARRAYGQAASQHADDSALRHKADVLSRLVPSLPDADRAAVKQAAPDASTTAIAAAHATPAASPEPSSPPAGSGDSRQAIDDVLSRWAKAWSAQDFPAYLAVYSNDYQPAGETSMAQWIREQKSRVTTPRSVAVSVSDVQITPDGADRARATFEEHYRAPGSDREATRHMLFVREDGAWRIRRES